MKYLAILLISLPAFGQFGAASRILSGTGAPVSAQCTVENNVGLVWARKDGADVGTTFYVCGATGVGTYGWELRGGAPGGASTLTTVGSVPFVTSSGVLGQNTNFRFFAGTGNLVVGTTTDDGTNRLQVAGSGLFAGNLTVSNQGTNGYLRIFDSTPAASNPAKFLTVASGQLRFYNNAYLTSLMALADNGNLLLGTTTDGNFRLDVAASGSSGTTRIYDQTPTTGSTSLVVRAGAGQGSNNLQTWQNAAGASLAFVSNTGLILSNNGFYLSSDKWYAQASTVDVSSDYLYRFSSTANYAGTKDLSLSRASANTLQVGDGGANANGAVNARSIALAASAAFGTHITFDTNTGADGIITSSSAGSLQFGTTNVGPLALIHNNVELLQLSSNTVTITNPTPTTGSTSLVVRAGAGQGSNNLQEWRDSSNTVMARISSSGTSFAAGFTSTNGVYASVATDVALDASATGAVLLRPNAGSERVRVSSTFIRTTNTQQFQFSSDATSFGTPDLSLSRASANTLQVGDGSGNANGTILARIHTWANGTEGTCDATLRGQVVMVQGGAGVADTFRVCRKDAANAYAWTALY